MKRKCAFTICTKSYIGYVQVLRYSIMKHTNDIDFFLVIADSLDNVKQEIDTSYIFEGKSILNTISDSKWMEYTFKYNLTEFCTRIKPDSFAYFFNSGYDEVCYFDPDLFFFKDPCDIYKNFSNYLILLTPHIVNMSIEERSDSSEFDARLSGIFNFGFIGLKKDKKTLDFIKWWSNRLDDKCYFDSVNFLCTDQKWGDLIPVFFDSQDVFISRSMGWNCAPWNYSERKIIKKGKIWYVRNRFNENIEEEIFFAHYSGYDYIRLMDGEILQKNDHHSIEYDDIKPFECFYVSQLQEFREVFFNYITLPYTYNFYSNGVKIEKMHRRLYHSTLFQNMEIGNPFDAKNEKFFLKLQELNMFSTNINDNLDAQIISPKTAKLLKVFNFLMRVLYRRLGYKRYLSILKLFQATSWYENQLHLLDKSNNALYFRKKII